MISDGVEAGFDLLVVVAGGAGGLFVGCLVAGDEVGVVSIEVVEEDFFGWALEKEDSAAEPLGSVGFGLLGKGQELWLCVVDAGEDWGGDDAAADAGLG